MADKKQTRRPGLRVDPAIDELLATSVENRAALSTKQKRDRSRTKATYDLDPTLQQAIAATAKELDTSSSQVVAMFLAYGLAAYTRQETGLMDGLAVRWPARTPRFSWNLRLPDDWRQAVERAAQKPLPAGWRKRG